MSRKRFLPIVSVLMVVCLLIGLNIGSVNAANDSAEYVEGTVYTFGEKEKYDFSGARSVVVQPQSGAKSTKTYGLFSISGAISSDGAREGFPSYKVNSGVVTLTYAYTDAMLKQRETQWHLVEDKSKQIDSISGLVKKSAVGKHPKSGTG